MNEDNAVPMTADQIDQLVTTVGNSVVVDQLLPDEGETMAALRSKYEAGRSLIPVRNISMWNNPHRNNSHQSESVECNIRHFEQKHLISCTAGYLGKDSPTGNQGDINAEAFHFNFSLMTLTDNGTVSTTPRWPLHNENGSVIPEHKVKHERCPIQYLLIGSHIHAADLPTAAILINTIINGDKPLGEVLTQADVDEFARVNNSFDMNDGAIWDSRYPDLLTESEKTEANNLRGEEGVVMAKRNKLTHLRTLVIDWLVHHDHSSMGETVTADFIKQLLTKPPERDFNSEPRTTVSVSTQKQYYSNPALTSGVRVVSNTRALPVF